MKDKLRQFMIGRYGMDELGRVLNVPAMVLLVVGILTVPVVSLAGAAVVVYSYYRALSRNTAARSKENAWYLQKKARVVGTFRNRKKRFTQRNTHKFFTCASCKKTIRVPKGKGDIEITCPVCHNRFTGRT